MKRLHFMIGLFAALIGLSLNAQTTTLLRANIPFDFQFGESVLPAGEYVIHYSYGQRTVIMQEQKEHGRSAAVMLNTVSRDRPPETGVLEFNRYGETYFFSKLWTPLSADGGAVFKTAREKELARNSLKPHTTEIALRSK